MVVFAKDNGFRSMAFSNERKSALLKHRMKRIEKATSNRVRRGGISILDLTNESVFNNYLLDRDPLTATDAGSNVTLTVLGVRIFWTDKKDGIQYRPKALTGLEYSTQYAVFIDNPERDGTTTEFFFTRAGQEITKETRQGRLFLGTITTPAQAAGDTAGDGNGGGGTGSGSIVGFGIREGLLP